MYVLDLQTFRYLAVNDAALSLYGYDRADFLALRQRDLRVATQAAQLREDRRALRRGDKKHFRNTLHRTKRGDILDVEIDISDVVFEGRPAAVVVVSDVTERVRLQNELQRVGFHDALTGLPNRALFADRVSHAFARGNRHSALFAVLFLDIDNFKTINDGLGHAVGDGLLTMVADRILAELRAEDTAARFGGDEFAILLENQTDPTRVVQVCERLAAALRVGFTVGGTLVSVEVSIGITYSSDAMSADELLRNADVAMYGAKAKGKARFQIYEAAMHRRVVHRLQLESDFRAAVLGASLGVHYQPVIELPSLRVVGVEALARWEHPTRGTVTPSEFIPLAESSGLIVPLGVAILNQACLQVSRWQRDIPGLEDLNAAVNISRRQLEDPSLVADVQAALRTSGLRADRLVLEITESCLMRDMATAAGRLAELHALGVKLAIDDFGTGYSSLSHLLSFPIDILKVDKSFVDDIDHSEMASRLLTGVVRLGESLGLDVVTEGVETLAQASLIGRLGKIYVQGFLYARPDDAASLTAFLSGYQRLEAVAARSRDVGDWGGDNRLLDAESARGRK